MFENTWNIIIDWFRNRSERAKLPEAIEYRETLAILQKMNEPDTKKIIEQEIEDEFPSYIN